MELEQLSIPLSFVELVGPLAHLDMAAAALAVRLAAGMRT